MNKNFIKSVTNLSFICLVPATVVSLPENVSVVAGSNLNLTCLVYGDPSPSVYWIRNGLRVKSYAVLSEGNRTLIIRSVAVEDEGAFTCVTVNRAGNDSSRVYVEVKGLLSTTVVI